MRLQIILFVKLNITFKNYINNIVFVNWICRVFYITSGCQYKFIGVIIITKWYVVIYVQNITYKIMGILLQVLHWTVHVRTKHNFKWYKTTKSFSQQFQKHNDGNCDKCIFGCHIGFPVLNNLKHFKVNLVKAFV